MALRLRRSGQRLRDWYSRTLRGDSVPGGSHSEEWGSLPRTLGEWDGMSSSLEDPIELASYARSRWTSGGFTHGLGGREDESNRP